MRTWPAPDPVKVLHLFVPTWPLGWVGVWSEVHALALLDDRQTRDMEHEHRVGARMQAELLRPERDDTLAQIREHRTARHLWRDDDAPPESSGMEGSEHRAAVPGSEVDDALLQIGEGEGVAASGCWSVVSGREAGVARPRECICRGWFCRLGGRRGGGGARRS